MFLYKITQDVNDDYDTFTGAIVVSACEETAKRIHPGRPCKLLNGRFIDINSGEEDRSWARIKDVQVEFLGVAKASLEEGVVLASFRSG